MAISNKERQEKHRLKNRLMSDNFKSLARDVYNASVQINALQGTIDIFMKEKPTNDLEWIQLILKQITDKPPFDVITLKILLEMTK